MLGFTEGLEVDGDFEGAELKGALLGFTEGAELTGTLEGEVVGEPVGVSEGCDVVGE